MTPQRTVPVEPFPPADDYERPPPSEEQPVPLVSERVPTMRCLSEQIAAVGREVHETRAELGELRRYVMGDHAPRITQAESSISHVERATRKLTVHPTVKKGAALGGAAVIYPVVEALWPVVRHWIETR